MAEKKRLLSVRVDELSLVDRPAVSKATFLIAKRAPQQTELTLDVLEKRIDTLEAYQRGETEASDGHIHTLMTIKEAREVMAKGMPQEEPAEVELTPEDAARISAMLATIGASV